jgi:DNA/RNA-binding domain of Phe-tRNA-synthetase-like protein
MYQLSQSLVTAERECANTLAPLRFRVEPEIFGHFPGMRIAVAFARGVENARGCDAVDRLWREAWSEAAAHAQYGNAQSHPRVAPWRDRFRLIGVKAKDYPSSIEALLRRALKGAEPFSINPLVDFYNAVSLRHVLPAGGFDVGQIDGIDLRVTRGGDTFTPLDSGATEEVPPGEAAYLAGHTVLTRHLVWRQSKVALIVPATCDVFLVSEVLGEIGGSAAEEVAEDFRSGLTGYFGVTPAIEIVDQQSSEIVF